MLSKPLQEFCKDATSHPAVLNLIPLEATWSYPIPAYRAGLAYLRFLIYQRDQTLGQDLVNYYPPFAVLSVEVATGRIVEFVETAFAKGIEESQVPLGQYPHPATLGRCFDDFDLLYQEFYSVTEKLLPLVGKRGLTAQEREYVNRYRELFAMLVEPELRAPYEELSPEFFQWLNES